jgi:hypothetical protein
MAFRPSFGFSRLALCAESLKTYLFEPIYLLLSAILHFSLHFTDSVIRYCRHAIIDALMVFRAMFCCLICRGSPGDIAYAERCLPAPVRCHATFDGVHYTPFAFAMPRTRYIVIFH